MKKLQLVLVLLACVFGSVAGFDARASKTIFIVNRAGWNPLCVHAYDGSGNTSGGWSALQVTEKHSQKYNNEDVYLYTFNDDRFTKVMFNNNGGSGTNQTAEKALTDKALYIIETSESNNNKNCTVVSSGHGLTTETTEPDPTPAELPASITLKGYIDGDGNQTTFTINKNSEDKYVTTVNLSKTYYFWFEANDKCYGSNTGGAGEGVSKNVTKTTQNNGTDNAKRYNVAAGNYTVTAWFDNNVIKFTLGDATTVNPDPELPAQLLLQGYKPGSGVWHTFATANKNSDDKYPFTINAETEYKFVFVTNGHRYTPNKNSGNETVTGGGTFLTREKANNYNEQQFVLTQGTYEGEAWWENGVVKFRIERKVVSRAGRTLYMHFGQNFIEKGQRSTTKPMVKLWSSVNTTGEMNIDGSKEMTKVTGYGLTEYDDLYMYEMTEEEYARTKDATFWFWLKNSDQKDFYCAGKENNKDDNTKDDYNWDADNWTKYIYYVSDNGKAGQSYITIDEYLGLRQQGHNKIWLTGRGFAEFDGKEWSIKAADMMSADATMHVFYPEFTWSTATGANQGLTSLSFDNGQSYTGAMFKMSWLHPYEWYEKSGRSGGAIHDTRCWMTFNLGIIGYDLEKVKGNSNLQSVLNPKTSGENVLFENAKTMPHNNHNQYNWFLAKSDNDQTLVVDLDDECQSVTLLPFKPNPTVKANDVTIETVEYGYANAANAWKGASMLAEEANGKVLYNYVNVASADATINAPTSADIKNYDYSVLYELYSQRQPVGTYSGDVLNGSAAVRLEAIAYGYDSQLGVRAKYTDNKTKMTFHSKYAEDHIVDTYVLKAPDFELTKPTYTAGSNFLFDEDGNLIKDNTLDPRYTLGAKADVEVYAPQLESNLEHLVWYGDFQSKIADESWADCHHKDHQWHANGGELKLAEAHNPWNEDSFSGYAHANNWAQTLGKTEASGMTDVWPVELPEVVEVHRTYEDNGWQFSESGRPAEVYIDVKVGAVYPFLIDLSAEIQPVGVRQSSRRKAYTPVEGHNYGVVPVAMYADAKQYKLDDNHLTGVSEAFLGTANGAGAEADAPVEYYNLQGMRVSGDMAPGIYIRREGNKTDKIIIR